MSTFKCPGSEELSRAFSLGASDDLQVHLGDCAACRQRWVGFSELVRLGRQLPFTAPEWARQDELRAALLRAAAGAAGRRRVTPRVWLAAAVMLLCLGLGLRGLFGWGRQPQLALRATVHLQGVVHFTHLGPSQDEIVRLSEGSILVEVDPLHPGERFRVVTGDGEVEVRGTVFEVAVAGDHLQRVRVLRGKVEVRQPHGGSMMLLSGDHWQAAAPSARAAAAPEPSPAKVGPGPVSAKVGPGPVSAKVGPGPVPGDTASRVTRHSAHSSHLVLPRPVGSPLKAAGRVLPGPAEEAFDEGWTALRAGRYVIAAAAFQRSTAVGSGQPIDEDAWFWRGVALARGGRNGDAVRTLRDFLSRYPHSTRAGEGSSILGWLLVDSAQRSSAPFIDIGALDEAERRFQSAQSDRDAEVKKSARSGMEAVAARRGQPAR